MFNHVLKYVLLVGLSMTLVACQDDAPVLKVGSKSFAESQVLAEMIAQLAENEGIEVERKIPYGDTNQILQAVKEAHIDVYPEYNGTSLIFLGQAPSSDSAASTATVNRLFKPEGLEMGAGFGFANDYVMVMTQERAAALNVSKISDLAGLSDPATFSIDEDFLKRPADGLQQMNRRYGITGSQYVAFPVGSEGKDQQISALLEGSADVGELYSTDGQIAEYNLMVLEDDLQFFPVYDAMPLVRSAALVSIPQLQTVLEQLSGTISAADMQALNKAVDLDAQTPATVATAFLESKGLLPEGTAGKDVETVALAVDPSVKNSSLTAKALRAMRAGFSGNNLELSNTAEPLNDLAEGKARVAMVGTDAFYELGEDGTAVEKQKAEAFAVLGYRTAHLIGRRGQEGADSITGMKKIVTGPEGSGSAHVLKMVLASLGRQDVAVTYSDASIDAQVDDLVQGKYDGVFIMVPQSDREVKSALVNAAVRLVSLDEWASGGHTARFSFIRPATIPARTYSAQYQPVASVSTQLVLAGPVEQVRDTGEVGPGTAGTVEGGAVPVNKDTVVAIRKVLGETDVIDPAIPVHASLVPSIEMADKALPFRFDISIFNILAIVFTIWMIYLATLPSPRRFTLPEDDDGVKHQRSK
ncbi:MAG: glycine betaine ABC transporter substrate-binding protein [Thiolinea sp.]